ncbi:MAG: hypothetical protein WD511_01410 [Balneolaceae bacterium]
MSDQNQKDPLDQFFQRKAEEYDISFREDDWHDLEKKLDHRQVARSRQRRTFFAAAAVLLVVSAMGYLIYNNSNKIDQLNQKLEDNLTTDVLPDSLQEDTLEQQDPSQLIDPQTLANISPERSGFPEDSDETVQEAQTDDRDELAAAKADVEPIDIGISPNIELQTVSSLDIRKDISTSAGNYIPNNPGYLASLSHKQTAVPSEAVLQYDEPNGSDLSRLEFGLIMSPDISTIGTVSNFHEPGYKFGITAGYRINDRFTISGGVIHSKVKYSSESNYYNPPEYWNSGSDPSGIRAVCLILDIPISLKYDMIKFENSRFFATGGLSSYVMLSEDYRFDYDGYSNGQITSQNERSGTPHIFSNAGFSIGYEYDFHQKWSLKAEPFIKVPLREVGWGNVKLYTLGTFVSVSYKL